MTFLLGLHGLTTLDTSHSSERPDFCHQATSIWSRVICASSMEGVWEWSGFVLKMGIQNCDVDGKYDEKAHQIGEGEAIFRQTHVGLLHVSWKARHSPDLWVVPFVESNGPHTVSIVSRYLPLYPIQSWKILKILEGLQSSISNPSYVLSSKHCIYGAGINNTTHKSVCNRIDDQI